MFGKAVVRDMIERSAENETDRRVFLKAAGVAGLGDVGGRALVGASAAPHPPPGPPPSRPPTARS